MKKNLFAHNLSENIALRKSVFENNAWEGKENWKGKNAVDGLYRDRTAGGGQCVISENDRETAEWRVDLEGIVSISHINIYYRTDNKPSMESFNRQ